MNRSPCLPCLVACMLLSSATGARAEPPAAAPATAPAYRDPQLPFGQRWMVPYPGYPTARVWRMRRAGEVYAHTTAQSIGDESAIVLYQPRGAAGGEIIVYDVGAQENDKQHDLSTYKGVTFWLKGDGGDGVISVGCNWNQTNQNNPLIGKFPLSDSGWKKHFVPWEKFARPPGKGGFWYINFSLRPETEREARATVTRLSLYKDEQTEPTVTPAEQDPPGLIPADKFVEPSVEAAQAMLPKTLTKLRAKEPITIVATGDSITAGAQLWYMNPEGKLDVGHRAIYFSVLMRKLAEHYGYPEGRHRFAFEMWANPNKKNDPNAKPDFHFMTEPRPEPDGTMPFDGLQVIGVGAGGMDTRFGEKHLPDVTQYKPDLVIWFYGGNDVSANRQAEYREPSLRVIKALRDQGVEVVVVTPTPWLDAVNFQRSLAFREITREIARESGVPMVDQLGAFLARGDRYKGDLLSDVVHPNEFGHETMAATLAALLGVPEQRVWDQPWFRANR